MTKHIARHRAACRPVTPLTDVVNSIAESDARRKVAAVAVSGVALTTVVGAGVPAAIGAGPSVAPAAVDTAALTADLVDEVSANPEITASEVAAFAPASVTAKVDLLSDRVSEVL